MSSAVLCLHNNTCLLENLESGTDYEVKVQGIYITGESSAAGPSETFTTGLLVLM